MSISQTQLDTIFPPEKSDRFFDALYGAAEDGAYTIRLECTAQTPERLDCIFALHRRPGQCLVCQLTHGLPHVFRRHPVINAAGVAQELAALAGWDPKTVRWEIGETIQKNDSLHLIPFTVSAV